MSKLKGRIVKRVQPQTSQPTGFLDASYFGQEMKALKDDIVNTVEQELEKVDEVTKKAHDSLDVKIEGVSTIVDKANEHIQQLHEEMVAIIKDMKTGPAGLDADEEAMIRSVLDKFPKKEDLVQEVLAQIPKVDEKAMVKKIVASLPDRKADLKIIQENITIDPMDVIDKIMALPEGKLNLRTSHIEGLDQTIQAFRTQLSRGYLHGAGLSTVSHDATLSGTGTPASPLSVVTTTAGVNTINADATPNQFLVVGTAGTDFAIVDNGTGTHTFNLPTASAVNRGALSSADWSTFNAKQPAGNYITALTGDVTASGPGSVAATLATVNGNVGTFGSATQTVTVTADGKGRITAISQQTVTPAASSITGIVALSQGGTSANLTASNGGIFYSTAAAGAILAGTATAGLALVSGASTTPSWFTPTLGSIIFAGTGGALTQNNSNWFIADSANKMLLGITSVTDPLIGATSRAIIFSGTASGLIGNDVNTTANTAGQPFVVRAGSATAGSTDKNGGTLFLRPGATTGYLTRALNNAVLIQSSPQLISGAIGTISATPTAGGAGYTQGDTLTITTGDGTATVTATTVVAGAVTVATLVSGGTSGYAVSAGNATSGGTGAGCTLSITALTGTAANVLVTTAYFTDSGLHIGGGASSATARLQISPGSVGTGATSLAWTTAGIWLRVVSGTYTDNTSAGSSTVATVVGGSIAVPTFAFANTSVTVTDAANLYINGAAAAGTNATFTNAWALMIAAGGMLNINTSATTYQNELRSSRSAIVATNIIGGAVYRSNDTSLTAPGTIVASFAAVANETHTGSTLGTDFIWQVTKTLTMFTAMTLRGITTTVGGLGINVAAPTAQVHIGAGGTAASTAPLKFTSGTNMTTAEAGAMEYDGTNLFFTRAGTTRENVLVAVDNAAAPGTSVGVAIVNYYGTSATNFLATPNRWMSINILGTVYKVALYT